MRVPALLAAAAAAMAPHAYGAPIPAGLDPDGVYRGINLGGWLVLESWLTPSLYSTHGVASGQGEWQFCDTVGRDQCGDVLTPHWDTWVTEERIATLAAAGLQYARIPLGYWIVDRNATEPLPAGGWFYLERALGWLKAHGMRAVLDLHGAPGSQNGHDNSGRTGDIQWNRPENINRTVSVLAEIARRVMAFESNATLSGVVHGIETLNEPWTPAVNGPIQYSTLIDFYQRSYAAIRGTGFNGSIWISDGFAGSGVWSGVMSPPAYVDVMLDSHLYHCFGGPTTDMSQWATTRYACDSDGPGVASRTVADWVVVGEWSNSLKNGNPETGVVPIAPAAASWLRAMTASQLAAWDGSFTGGPGRGKGPGKGSFFWNFYTETRIPGWDMLLLLEQGAAPPQLNTANMSQFEYTC